MPFASAQEAPAKPPAEQVSKDALGRSTPRGTFVNFLTLCQNQDYPRAAQFLDTRLKGNTAEQLAVQLYTVLNRRMPVNLQKLDDSPEGDTGDGLPPDRELAGVVKASKGTVEILLARVQQNRQPIWLFAAETLSQIPEVYEEIGPSFIEPYLPAAMVSHSWLDIALWKWIALLVGFVMAAILSRLLRQFLVLLLRPATGRLTAYQGDRVLQNLVGPLRAVIVLLFIQYTVSVLSLPLLVRLVWFGIRSKLLIVFAAWLFIRLAKICADLLRRRMESAGKADATAVLRLAQRTVNVLAVFAAIVLLLASAGYNVSGMLAGLGVGGIAVAFAAQKTLENLFGGISVIFDKPIRVGDTCSIGDRVGVVEDIGLRSTRLRTRERTVVTIPNGQLSTMTLENFALRDKIWLNHTLGLNEQTTAEQLRQVLTGLRKLLADNSMVEDMTARVRFVRCAASSFDIEIHAFVLTPNFEKFLEIQEELLIEALAVIEASGTKASMPSQLLYLARAQSTTTRD